MRLNNYDVSKGSFVYVSLYSLHTNQLLWENPGSFDPGRWSLNDGQDDPNALKDALVDGASGNINIFLPFSNGPRSCIAQVLFMSFEVSSYFHVDNKLTSNLFNDS